MSTVARLLPVVSIVFFLVTPSAAQTITQEEFLALLRENHPIFTSERMNARIASEARAGLLGAQDWYVTSSAALSHESEVISGFGPETTTAFSLGGGLSRALWATGGRVSYNAAVTVVGLDADPMLGLPDDYYQSEIEVSYYQPLMKNKGGALDRLEYDLKDYDIRSAEILALEAEEEFLAEAAAAFLDWVFLTEQNEITRERLELSREELRRTIRKRDAYLIDEADVIRAEDATRFWEQNLVLGEARWEALRAELAVLAQSDALLTATPSYDLDATAAVPTLAEASEVLARDSRIVRDLQVRVEQLRLLRGGYEETARPELALVAELSSKGADDSFFESFVLDKPGATLALQLGLPLKNTTANSQITQTDLEIERLEMRIEDVRIALTSGLSSVHTQMTRLDSVLALNRQQIESSRRRTEEELDLYNHGRGELTFVIQSRDNEQQARLTYVQNALAYHKLLVAYRSLMDELHTGR